MERLDTFELLGVFHEGLIGLIAYCSSYCVCSKLRRYVLRLKKRV